MRTSSANHSENTPEKWSWMFVIAVVSGIASGVVINQVEDLRGSEIRFAGAIIGVVTGLSWILTGAMYSKASKKPTETT